MRLDFERHVPHSPERMLALVEDVESYPRFIPHCESMQVWRDVNRPDTAFKALMHIRFGPIAQSYTSAIDVDRQRMTLSARSTDGPFSHLHSVWLFEPEGTGARIRFEIDFRIGNPLIRKIAEPAFAAKQAEIVDAFVSEADRRYG